MPGAYGKKRLRHGINPCAAGPNRDPRLHDGMDAMAMDVVMATAMVVVVVVVTL